jgi:ADP-ribose pyrophosphatase
MSERDFEPLGGETLHEGGFFDLRLERFRFADGEEVERDIVRHPGAVGVVCVDDEHIWLVRQPRPAVGDPDVLEIPAGKLDEGESPLETGKRELAEEIGKGARNWEHLTTCYASPGFTDEQMHIYLATDLYDADTEPDESERMELRLVPLDDLDTAIRDCHDAKTLVGLLWLRAFGR